MDIKNQINGLLKEGELYQSQGLLDEAKQKYDDAARLIRENDQFEGRQDLLHSVSERMKALGGDFDRVEKAEKSPELSPRVQDLIKNLFSFSQEEDKDALELEGALALAKFGQFERALAEFDKLITKDSFRVVAAKNILRCHIAKGSPDDAVDQYEQWLSGDIVFSSQQFEKIRIFLQNILDRKGIDRRLPSVVRSTAVDTVVKPIDVVEHELPEEEEFLDITFIGIKLDSGPQKGKLIEFDVNFQRGNVVSVIVTGRDKDLTSSLKVGQKISEVECSSAFAVFMASGVITEKMRIETGPNRGDYRLDIKVEST